MLIENRNECQALCFYKHSPSRALSEGSTIIAAEERGRRGRPPKSHGGKVTTVCLQSPGCGRRLLSMEGHRRIAPGNPVLQYPARPSLASRGCLIEIKCQVFVQWHHGRARCGSWHCVPVQSGNIPVPPGRAVAQRCTRDVIIYPGKEMLRIYCCPSSYLY